MRNIYTVCGVISIAFLLITLLVYATLPKLKNVQGKIVLANIVTILVTTATLIFLYNAVAVSPDEVLLDQTWSQELTDTGSFHLNKN